MAVPVPAAGVMTKAAAAGVGSGGGGSFLSLTFTVPITVFALGPQSRQLSPKCAYISSNFSVSIHCLRYFQIFNKELTLF